ncbi:MAG TPA: hypothetical protein VGF48_19825 [Thermoanaerobaculia bacterium]|jgi:hypothetical protein
MQFHLLLVALFALAPVLDGVLGTDEWSGPAVRRESMEGGGEVWLRRDGDRLFVAVKSLKRGIASLCTGNKDDVEILHASAALGTARFHREGKEWKPMRSFSWTTRADATAEERAAHMASAGWLANASTAPNLVREFEIRLQPGRELVGVAFLHTDEPQSVAYWPKSMRDDCAAIDLAQGYVHEKMRFDPRKWSKARQ